MYFSDFYYYGSAEGVIAVVSLYNPMYLMVVVTIQDGDLSEDGYGIDISSLTLKIARQVIASFIQLHLSYCGAFVQSVEGTIVVVDYWLLLWL